MKLLPLARWVQSVPPAISDVCVIRRKLVPIGAADSIQVVHDLPAFHSHLAHEFSIASHFGAVHVRETELALSHSKHAHIRRRANREISKLVMMDLPRRIPGGT